ncbi:MAG: undecaprenyldiphospho-muramoylpentapeptide beta-N-acetylglucosaminyltransferase [Saprospiraceae bacterium]|nr:undecaprenyldiphospho-muramoylpentapeptide beta-N-acetylglucosaminyltransferase [Saprospiraceae bacterium]
MKAIISGGGTGGHIYPAIAMADAIMAQWPEAEVRFVGASGRMEMEKVPRAGYPIEGLWISGFQRKSSLKNLLLPFKVSHSLWRSWQILRSFSPDIAIGVGGYASGPLLYVASTLNIPTMIQEQNSFPGITNRLLGRKVDRICVAFEDMDRFFDSEKIVLTGNPVRDLKLPLSERGQAYEHFGLDPDRKTVLVVGGSLGSLTLNQSMAGSDNRISESDQMQFIWQIGDLYMDRYGDSETAGLENVCPLRFIERMDLAYAAADLVVCRAGALTLSELAMCEKAALLVPSPNVAEDHQTKNAMALVREGAAEIMRDEECVESMIEKVEKLIADEDRLQMLSENISNWAKPNATRDIISVIKRLTT